MRAAKNVSPAPECPEQKQQDPLYTIFEQHLYNFQDSEADRKTFIGQVVADYLTYLRRAGIVVPPQMEALMIEELAHQVNSMLVKKIYGFYNINEFVAKSKPAAKKRARKQYEKVAPKPRVKIRAKAA